MGKTSEGVLNEGKTKFVLAVEGDPMAVDLEAKAAITAFNDPKFTDSIATKPGYATTTTSRVFELLRTAGIPVAYREQISPTRFRADKCDMVMLEVIIRRYIPNGSSYLDRYPQLLLETLPYRYPTLKVDFHLKTTDTAFVDRGGVRTELNITAKKDEDPLIADPHADIWVLHKKRPSWDKEVVLGEVDANRVIDPARDSKGKFVNIKEMEKLARQVFLVLEKVWGMMGFDIYDLKIEFGITADGRLVVADVIDNDSWRLADPDGRDVSKEAFRQGEPTGQVEKNYELVADMIQRFRVPKQALVVWSGSINDKPLLAKKSFDDIPGIFVEEVILSGHKSTGKCLRELNELLKRYHSGLILANIGMSNGLGPILSAHTNWGVIGVPADLDKFPEDIWSNLRTPSNVPMLVCLPKNAEGVARNLLAQQNPYLYMQQELAIEALDRW